MSESLCFCGSRSAFSECCGAVINGQRLARTPEELMRSRYSAHCLRDYAYLVESVHPDHRDGVTTGEIESWAKNIEWTGLEVHTATPGPGDDQGSVSFTAHFTVKDTPQLMREDAEFLRVKDRWYYVDGQVRGQDPYRREEPKIGRNDPCFCGSGKKYKKCCGA